MILFSGLGVMNIEVKRLWFCLIRHTFLWDPVLHGKQVLQPVPCKGWLEPRSLSDQLGEAAWCLPQSSRHFQHTSGMEALIAAIRTFQPLHVVVWCPCVSERSAPEFFLLIVSSIYGKTEQIINSMNDDKF